MSRLSTQVLKKIRASTRKFSQFSPSKSLRNLTYCSNLQWHAHNFALLKEGRDWNILASSWLLIEMDFLGNYSILCRFKYNLISLHTCVWDLFISYRTLVPERIFRKLRPFKWNIRWGNSIVALWEVTKIEQAIPKIDLYTSLSNILEIQC